MTGTATSVTTEQITTLKLSNPELLKLPFIRDNLIFEVLDKKSGYTHSLQQVTQLIKEQFYGQCGIVYCNRRDDTAQLSLELKSKDIFSIYFHGGIVDPGGPYPQEQRFLPPKFCQQMICVIY